MRSCLRDPSVAFACSRWFTLFPLVSRGALCLPGTPAMNPDRSPESREQQDSHDLRNWQWPPHWTSEPPFLAHENMTPVLGTRHASLSESLSAGGGEFSNPPYPHVVTEGSHFMGHWRPIPRSLSMSTLPASVSQFAPFRNEQPVPPPRQIRFVPNDGQPHARRRRIKSA